MRRFSLLAILFLALCAACILLMRSCGGDRREEPQATLPPANDILNATVPESTPAPTPAPTPEPTPSYEGSVWTTSDVNLRRAPGTDGEIITAVDKDVELHRVGLAENGWSKILYELNGEEVTCYVNSDYLTTVSPGALTPNATPGTESGGTAPAASGFAVTSCDDTVWTTDGMNLRRGPGTDYDVAVTVEKNTQLRRTGVTDNGWSRVLYESVGYFVSSDYLTTVKPEELGGDEGKAEGENGDSAAAAAASFETSGEFASDTGVPLNLIVRWNVADRGDGSKTLTLSAALSSCSLQSASFADNLCFKVGNDTFNLTTPDINVDSTSLTETPLGTCTAVVSQFNVPVSVTWHFNGSYSGQQLGDITASSTLKLG